MVSRIPADPQKGVFEDWAKHHQFDPKGEPLSKDGFLLPPPRFHEKKGEHFSYEVVADLGYGELVLRTPTNPAEKSNGAHPNPAGLPLDSEGGGGNNGPRLASFGRLPGVFANTARSPFALFPATEVMQVAAYDAPRYTRVALSFGFYETPFYLAITSHPLIWL